MKCSNLKNLPEHVPYHNRDHMDHWLCWLRMMELILQYIWQQQVEKAAIEGKFSLIVHDLKRTDIYLIQLQDRKALFFKIYSIKESNYVGRSIGGPFQAVMMNFIIIPIMKSGRKDRHHVLLISSTFSLILELFFLQICLWDMRHIPKVPSQDGQDRLWKLLYETAWEISLAIWTHEDQCLLYFKVKKCHTEKWLLVSGSSWCPGNKFSLCSYFTGIRQESSH